VEFNKRNFNNEGDRGSNRDNNRDDRNSNRDNNRDNRGPNRDGAENYNRERNFSGNRDNRDGNAFRERFNNGGGNRENRDGGNGGGFRERSFGGNRDGGGGSNRGGGDDRGGFRREFRDERPPRPQHELVQSAKFRAGKRRTYFFDVRKTENGDHYMTLTESTQKVNGGYDRNKVFLYKEDFNRFVRELGTMVDLIKNDLQPDYDYDEFERRQLEWEEQRRLDIENGTYEDPRDRREQNDGADNGGAEIAERRVFSFSKSKLEDDMMEERPVAKKEAPVEGTPKDAEDFNDESQAKIDDDMAW
jgi:hypothetical protein